MECGMKHNIVDEIREEIGRFKAEHHSRERARLRLETSATHRPASPRRLRFAAQKSTCLRASRHLFDNEQTACMEASKLHCSSFSHQSLRSWSCKRRTASIAVAFAALERQR